MFILCVAQKVQQKFLTCYSVMSSKLILYCVFLPYKIDQSEFIIAVLEVLSLKKSVMVVDSITGENQQM